MAQNPNPLSKYFRQAAIHVKLPSGGKYYPPGILNLPPNGEVPILPMTAVDEITARTPDALFNGSAVMDIIGSCVPNILDPWQVPMVDFNTLLVAIRLASYGHEMHLDSKCPNCSKVQTLDIDLRMVLDTLRMPDYDTNITSGDLQIYFAPLTYAQVNESSRINFEDQKIVQMINNNEMSEEEKMGKLGDAFREMTEITIRSISGSISAVKTSDALVTEKEYIVEFLHNCPKAMFDLIRDRAVSLREGTDIPPLRITCEECQHQYNQPFTLDMSNFFDNAS